MYIVSETSLQEKMKLVSFFLLLARCDAVAIGMR